MLFDERFIGPNATAETRDAWANDQWPRIQVIWSFLILLNFAALAHVDPVVVHWLSVLLRRFYDSSVPVVTATSEY